MSFDRKWSDRKWPDRKWPDREWPDRKRPYRKWPDRKWPASALYLTLHPIIEVFTLLAFKRFFNLIL